MKISIIGIGVVGGAIKYGFEKLGHNVFCHDLKLGTKIEGVLDSEICFICVPTPTNPQNCCDTSIVESVVSDLTAIKFQGVIAIKSTVKPGTTRRLIEKTGKRICFVPEFLRERCAVADFTENHDLLAVGTNSQEVFELIKEAHGDFPKSYSKLTPTEAELLKYYSNTYNATKIIFANEMYEICNALGADYSMVKKAFVQRGTTKDMYLDINENFRGYAGVCLPKDTLALDCLSRELGLQLDFFKMLDQENKKFKKTVFKGMRLE